MPNASSIQLQHLRVLNMVTSAPILTKTSIFLGRDQCLWKRRKKARKEPSKPAKPALLPEKNCCTECITYRAQEARKELTLISSSRKRPVFPLQKHELKGQERSRVMPPQQVKVIANTWLNTVPTPSQVSWKSCLCWGLG